MTNEHLEKINELNSEIKELVNVIDLIQKTKKEYQENNQARKFTYNWAAPIQIANAFDLAGILCRVYSLKPDRDIEAINYLEKYFTERLQQVKEEFSRL